MTEHAIKLGKRVRQQLHYMLIFSLMFMMVGFGSRQISNLYYERFDTTEYYKIIPPVRTNKRVYKPCEITDVYVTRDAKINTQGKSIIRLTLVESKDNVRSIIKYTRDIVVTQGVATMVGSWQLPCTAKAGTYYWEIDTRFYVGSLTKTAHYKTESFQIIK